MKQNINYRIGFIHLISKKKQTIIAILSVSFGVSMYIFMNSFVTGVNIVEATFTFNMQSHIHIYNDGSLDNSNLIKRTYKNTLIHLSNAHGAQNTGGIRRSAKLMEIIKSQPEVVNVTPQINSNVFFKNSSIKINGSVIGIDPENENRVFNTSSFMVRGNWNSLNYTSDGVIIGTGLAYELGLNINDILNVVTFDGVPKSYRVVGIFQTNVYLIDKTRAYININSARELLGKNKEYITDLQIDVENYKITAPFVDRIAPIVPYKVESWQMSNQQLESGAKLRDIVATAVSLTILLVGGFGIYNIMNMTISEKLKEIAILKAVGFSGVDVGMIFLFQTFLIGTIGGALGGICGLIFSFTVNHIPFKIGSLNNLPMAYLLKDYSLGYFFGMITAIMAGYLPSRKAAKVDPVEIIRG